MDLLKRLSRCQTMHLENPVPKIKLQFYSLKNLQEKKKKNLMNGIGIL